MKYRYLGFTLIEVLAAMTILAIVGMLMAMGLRSAIDIQKRVYQKSEELSTLQSAIIIIERDISQLIDRPILDTSSERLPAIILRQNNQETVFEFTRSGVINPYATQKRSTLQRIQYRYDGDTLTRQSWSGLDRTNDTPYQIQTLFKRLKSFNIKLIPRKEPVAPTQQPSNSGEPLPIAVEITLESDVFGYVSRYIKLVGDIIL